MTLIKRAFGLVTLTTGAALLLFALGQKVLVPDERFHWGPLVGGVVWGLISWHYGRKWLFNWIDMDVMGIDPGDPVIEAAVQRARSTLGVFWHYLDQHLHECYIKFPMETKEGVPEHIWAVVHARENDKVVVSLANAPVDEPSVSEGRRLVAVRDIEDWQVVVSPTEIRGGYTIGALATLAKQRGYSIAPKDRQSLAMFVDIWEPS